jgi:hypothetical protein
MNVAKAQQCATRSAAKHGDTMTDATQKGRLDRGLQASPEHAYRRLLPELLALPPEDLIQVNRDLKEAIATALGALPNVLALAPDMARLPDLDLRAIKNLETYALALEHAHAVRENLVQSPPKLRTLAAEANKLRTKLLAYTNALVQLGSLKPHKVKKLSGATGFSGIATDLQTLAGVLELYATQRQASDELATAKRIASELLEAIRQREERSTSLASANDMRTRAWTLLIRVYAQVHRAIAYLRWREGDVEVIAPPLRLGRSG